MQLLLVRHPARPCTRAPDSLKQLNSRPQISIARSPLRTRRIAPPPQALANTSIFEDGYSSFNALSQVLTGTAWLAALYLGFTYFLGQQRIDESNQRQSECETCEGTGYVDCLCNRWNDGDVGCNTCANSGKMACQSCRGGGRKIPIKAKVYIQPEQTYFRDNSNSTS